MSGFTRRCTLCLTLGVLVACQRDMPLSATGGAGGAGTTGSQVSGRQVAAAGVVESQRRLMMMRSSDAPPAERTPVDLLIEGLQARVERDPGKLDHVVELGRAWVRKARESGDPGFYRQADAAAEVALALVPEAPVALTLKGLVLLNDHRFAEARELMRGLLGRVPRDAMALGTLSDAALELGRYDEAIEAAQRMMEIKPNLPAYARASYLAWLRGDDKTAKEAIRLAIDAAPASRRDPEPRAWALVQAALIFFQQGDYEGADAGFVMAEQTFPDFPPALVGRGRVALAQGRLNEAVDLLARAYKKSPLCETAWLLGDARLAAGDKGGAEAAYADAARHGRRGDPRTLALLLATLGREPAEAVRLAEAEHGTRGDIYTDYAYALALFRAGRLKEARASIDHALRLGTKDARLLAHGGAIHLSTGDPEGGKAMLREALRLHPRFDLHGAAEAQRLLGGAVPAAAAAAGPAAAAAAGPAAAAAAGPAAAAAGPAAAAAAVPAAAGPAAAAAGPAAAAAPAATAAAPAAAAPPAVLAKGKAR